MNTGVINSYLECNKRMKSGLGIVGLGNKRFYKLYLSHRFVSVIRSKERL